MRIDSRHNPEQVRERYGVPHDRSHTAVTSCNGGSLTNGAAHADNLEHTQPTAEYNGFSSFVLRSTFASGILLCANFRISHISSLEKLIVCDH